MNTRALVIIGALSFIAGLAGLLNPLFPGRAAATTENVTLGVNPGPDHSPDALNCLWHSECTSPVKAGTALDWANSFSANEVIYWRSYGYRSLGSGTLGKGTIKDYTGTCSGIRVEVTDDFGFVKGSIYYVHQRSWTYGATFAINASPSWSYTSATIGFSWSDELPNCKSMLLWTGQHLHQDAQSGPYTPNYGVFTSLQSYPVDSYYDWQYRQSWQWNY